MCLSIVTVEPMYYGHLGTNKKCHDYRGVLIFQVGLYDKAPFGTITKCVDYAGVLIFSSVLINRFHCISMCAYTHTHTHTRMLCVSVSVCVQPIGCIIVSMAILDSVYKNFVLIIGPLYIMVPLYHKICLMFSVKNTWFSNTNYNSAFP